MVYVYVYLYIYIYIYTKFVFLRTSLPFCRMSTPFVLLMYICGCCVYLFVAVFQTSRREMGMPDARQMRCSAVRRELLFVSCNQCLKKKKEICICTSLCLIYFGSISIILESQRFWIMIMLLVMISVTHWQPHWWLREAAHIASTLTYKSAVVSYHIISHFIIVCIHIYIYIQRERDIDIWLVVCKLSCISTLNQKSTAICELSCIATLT